MVDSRLVAGELGIEHRALMQTIKKYLDRLERKEPVTFQMSLVKRPQGGTYEETYCYLSEYQATLLMTFSRNTEQVLNCKERLVDAFIEARQVIKTVIPSLEKDNEALRLMLELERERNKGKALDSTMIQLHGDRVVLALRGLSDQIVEKETVVTEVVEPETGSSVKILTADQLKKAIKDRTGQKLKSLKDFAETLRKAGRDDLLIPVKRSQTSEYPIPEKLDEAIAVVYGKCRQKLIGE